MQVHMIKDDWCPGEMKINTYVVEFDDFCIVIDAGASINEVKAITNKPIKAVFLTHGHYDHIRHVEEYDKLGIEIYANANIDMMLNDPQINISKAVGCPTRFTIKNLKKLYEDDMINVKDAVVYTYCTPGHSADSTTYLINDTLFTGDTVFSVAVGRTDLPSGNVEDLIQSLEKVSLLKYEDVYSGHGRKSNKEEQLTNICKWKNYLKSSISNIGE